MKNSNQVILEGVYIKNMLCADDLFVKLLFTSAILKKQCANKRIRIVGKLTNAGVLVEHADIYVNLAV